MAETFIINYFDGSGISQGLILHKPYPSNADGNLNFNNTNLSFRSGNYASYIDSINDEGIVLSGFENDDAMTKFVELGVIADEGYELMILGLNDALNGVYIIENFSYKPISLDVFEYNLTLKFVRAVEDWYFCLPKCFNCNMQLCDGCN
jgi:hypothetical protein